MIPIPEYVNIPEQYAWWEGFFSESELQLIESLPLWDNGNNATIGSGAGVFDKSHRSTKVAWIPMNEEYSWIYNRIAAAISEINGKYFFMDLDGIHESIQLGVYNASEDGHYDWHIDDDGRMGNNFRKLSFAMLISDPNQFEGGNLQLKYSVSEISVDQRRGRAWIFPSYTLHRVTKVTRGTRKSLVCWVSGKPFK